MFTKKNLPFNQIFLVLFASLSITFISCDNRGKNFTWNDEVAELTDKDLEEWLRNAPFENEITKKESDDQFVMTNADQVFPFIGRYYNHRGEIRKNLASTDTTIYEQKELIYKDPKFGDLFVTATLLYDDQEVYLSDSYSSMGDPLFGGIEAAQSSYDAVLYETPVFVKKPDYKTGLYWATSNNSTYLLGFYQKGQLIFETAIPMLESDSTAALNKLKEVNQKLNLNIPEWANATMDQLKVNDKPTSFWNDPYTSYYMGNYLLDDLMLKTKDTPFSEIDSVKKGDHYLAYQSEKGPVEFYFERKSTDKNEEDFKKEHADLPSYDNEYVKVFYNEKPVNGYVEGTAISYLKDNKYVEMQYRFHESDAEAQKNIHGILKYVKMHKL